MAIDPVCKMTVDEATAAATSEYQGKTYYFCAPGCKIAFDAEPQKYLAPTEEPVKKTLLQRLNPFKRD